MVTIKGNAFKYGYQVGDVVRYVGDSSINYTVKDDGRVYTQSGSRHIKFSDLPEDYVLVSRNATDNRSGGPSKYYDFPFQDWVTVNDMIEYLSEKKWGSLSWIFKDIVKACARWGDKDGTTKEYDARKIIYYGLRLLRSVAGKEAVASYLKELSNNEQFKE